MVGKEKRNLLDKSIQLCCSILIRDINILSKLLQGEHNIINTMRFQQIPKRKRRFCDSFSLHKLLYTWTVVQVVDFSATNSALFKNIEILSRGIWMRWWIHCRYFFCIRDRISLTVQVFFLRVRFGLHGYGWILLVSWCLAVWKSTFEYICS